MVLRAEVGTGIELRRFDEDALDGVKRDIVAFAGERNVIDDGRVKVVPTARQVLWERPTNLTGDTLEFEKCGSRL
jgi:hypothetical protein